MNAPKTSRRSASRSFGVLPSQILLTAAAFFLPTAVALAQCPPVIMVQPANQTVCAGGGVTFAVYATANTSLEYQWRKGGTDIPDATAATYQLPPVDSSDAGAYSVVVTADDCGTTTSSDAVLTVRDSLASSDEIFRPSE